MSAGFAAIHQKLHAAAGDVCPAPQYREYPLHARPADLPLLNHNVSKIGRFYSLDISCSPMDSSNAVIKRIEDLVLGTLGLIIFSPLMVAVAIAIKLTSPGPVLFKQLRYGVSGNPVKIYKFRSMKVHSEVKVP